MWPAFNHNPRVICVLSDTCGIRPGIGRLLLISLDERVAVRVYFGGGGGGWGLEPSSIWAEGACAGLSVLTLSRPDRGDSKGASNPRKSIQTHAISIGVLLFLAG